MIEHYKRLRVTITQDYFIEMQGPDTDLTHINGWTMEEVIKDWFEKHPMGSYHATRDGCKIGNSERFIKSEIVDS